MELTITKQVLPTVEFNKKELAEFANEITARYANLVFTVDDIASAKKTRAELNSLAKAVDDKRKTLMTEMSAPLAEFETTMKTVAKQIKDASTAIDVQVKNFEEVEKEKKRKQIDGLIAMVVVECQLDKKHAAQLTILDKYMNKTGDGTISKVTIDLKNRAEILKVAQTKVESDRNLVIQTCELHKEHFNVDIDSYLMLLDSGRDVAEIVSMINQKAQTERERKVEEERRRQQAEFEEKQRQQQAEFEAQQKAREEALRAQYEAKQAELQQQAQEPTPEPEVHEEPMSFTKEIMDSPVYTYDLRITGNGSKWDLLKKMLHKFDMPYEVLERVSTLEEAI